MRSLELEVFNLRRQLQTRDEQLSTFLDTNTGSIAEASLQAIKAMNNRLMKQAGEMRTQDDPDALATVDPDLQKEPPQVSHWAWDYPSCPYAQTLPCANNAKCRFCTAGCAFA